MAKEDSSGNNSFGLVSFIFGFIGAISTILILFALFAPVFGLILSVFGFIFGIIQLRRGKNGWAIWGIIFSIIGILINGGILYIFVTRVNEFLQQCQMYGGCREYIQAMVEAQAKAQAQNIVTGIQQNITAQYGIQ